MLLSLLLSTARADVAADVAAPEPCQISSPAFSQPANAAVDVPLDVVPAVFFQNGGCGDGSWSLTLSSGMDGAPTYTTTGSPVDGLLQLVPEASLSENTLYTLNIDSADGSGESSVITFTTGRDVTEPMGILPEVLDLTGEWTDATAFASLNSRVQFGETAGADVFSRWTYTAADEASLTSYRLVAPGNPVEGSADVGPLSQPIPDVCLTASTREFNATWSDGEPLCVELDDVSPVVCSTAGPGASAVAVGLALAVALQRRRREGLA